MNEYVNQLQIDAASAAIVPVKKIRKPRAKTDPKAGLEKRVAKAKSAIRGLAKKFPSELLDAESVNKIAAFLSSQVLQLRVDLMAAVNDGVGKMPEIFSLDTPVPMMTAEIAMTKMTWKTGENPCSEVKAVATERIYQPGKTVAPSENDGIDFVEDEG